MLIRLLLIAVGVALLNKMLKGKYLDKDEHNERGS